MLAQFSDVYMQQYAGDKFKKNATPDADIQELILLVLRPE